MDHRIEAGDTISIMMRAASAGLMNSHATNQHVLNRMQRAYLASVLLLLGEVAVLILDLARR